MKKLVVMIFLLISSLNAQESIKIERARQIINEARKAIEVKSPHEETKGLYLRTNSNTDGATSFREFSYQFSNNLYCTYATVPNAKSIFIWNADKYFEDFEMTLNGKVVRRSALNAVLAKRNEKTSKKPSEGTLSGELKDIEKKANSLPNDPRTNFLGNMWYYIFPVILQAPFEPDAQFEFVGKAEAANQQKANVVDVKSTYFRKFRLFFDEKTHLLLMMIVTTDKGNGIDYQERYYFSDYHQTNGLLVAKQIQRESREINTNTKNEKKLGNSFTTIEEFELNPKFSNDLFKID